MTPSWLNTNARRAYPFVAGTVGAKTAGPQALLRLPNGAVVDCGFVAGEATGFDPAAHTVFLRRAARVGSTFTLEFATDAPLMAGAYLAFTRDLADPDYLTEDVESDATHNVSVSDDCGEPLWSGFLVSGRMQALADFLGDGDEVFAGPGEAVVEPALVRSLAGAHVRGVSLANGDRTRADAPAGCEADVWPFETGLVYPGASCLVGDVLFSPGYNATVRQDAAANAVVLGAAPGAGAGQPCDEVPVFAGEAAPAWADTLSGGLLCGQAVRSINGVAGPLFVVSAGRGVTVLPDPDANAVVIDVSMVGLLVCGPGSAVSETV